MPTEAAASLVGKSLFYEASKPFSAQAPKEDPKEKERNRVRKWIAGALEIISERVRSCPEGRVRGGQMRGSGVTSG